MNQNLIIGILLAVILLSIIGVILIGSWMYRKGPSSKTQGRISSFVDSSKEESKTTPKQNTKLLSDQNIGKFREWINTSLRGFSSNKLKLKLSSAYWTITDAEFILIRIIASVFALLLGWLITGNILAGLLLAAIAIIVPPILLDRSISQRQQKFHNQLLDVLVLITGAVQAGYSLLQSLDLAVKEVPAPASEEFGRVLHEMRFGISLEGAFNNLAERMESEDMQIVVTAIVINSQIGGNLSTVLGSTMSTIRARMRLFGEIRSLTSYSKYVGNFLSLMPFILGFVIFLLSPNYFDTVKTSIFTRVILAMALISLILGNIWIKRIIQIKV